MLGTLSALAITSLFSLGSYAYSIAVPTQPPLVSPLPIQQKNPTPTPPSPIPTRASEPTDTPTPTIMPTAIPIPTETPTPLQPITTSPDLDALFQRFSDEYAVDKELLKKIARCESGLNTDAENGDYHGMFQFASSSWIATRGEMGLDTNTDLRKDVQEAIRTTAYKISHGGIGAWPSCSK